VGCQHQRCRCKWQMEDPHEHSEIMESAM
jgi:hypothetical protein